MLYEKLDIPYSAIVLATSRHLMMAVYSWNMLWERKGAIRCIVDRNILLSCHQNAGQNHDIKVANRCFENVAHVRYLGTAVTNQNLIQEEIKRRLNSGNACYQSVQNLLSSCLLSKNVKIRIYKTINLPVISYGCKNWSLTLREAHRLRVFLVNTVRNLRVP
jgi:hypothetical protein